MFVVVLQHSVVELPRVFAIISVASRRQVDNRNTTAECPSEAKEEISIYSLPALQLVPSHHRHPSPHTKPVGSLAWLWDPESPPSSTPL
jgi:hypothetical protein